jgi:predicted PurR-regulated permease PerM
MNVTVKLTGLLVILLIGVVLGLQTAERGISKVSGLPEQQLQTFYIQKVEQGQMEIAVMGKQVQTADPKKMVNYVSNMGLTLGSSIKSGAKTFVDWIGGFFEP